MSNQGHTPCQKSTDSQDYRSSCTSYFQFWFCRGISIPSVFCTDRPMTTPDVPCQPACITQHLSIMNEEWVLIKICTNIWLPLCNYCTDHVDIYWQTLHLMQKFKLLHFSHHIQPDRLSDREGYKINVDSSVRNKVT